MNGSACMEEQCRSKHDVHVLSNAKKGLCLAPPPPPPPRVYPWLMQKGEGGVSRVGESGGDEVSEDDCMVMLLVHGYRIHRSSYRLASCSRPERRAWSETSHLFSVPSQCCFPQQSCDIFVSTFLRNLQWRLVIRIPPQRVRAVLQ